MGLHKTGTTSFQETCYKNKDTLLAQGYVYPVFNSEEMIMKDMYNHSAPIYSLVCANPDKYHINIRCGVENVEVLNKDYLATLTQCLGMDKDVILCGEDISMLNCEALERLKQLIENYNFEIIPIVVVRPPYEFMCSMKQEGIKANVHCEHSFFSGRIKEIENIKKVFADTNFFAYKEICKHADGLVGFLFEYLKVDYKKFEIINSNIGTYNILTRVQNILNSSTKHWENAINKPNFINMANILHKYTIDEPSMLKEKYLLTQDEYPLCKIYAKKKIAILKKI